MNKHAVKSVAAGCSVAVATLMGTLPAAADVPVSSSGVGTAVASTPVAPASAAAPQSTRPPAKKPPVKSAPAVTDNAVGAAALADDMTRSGGVKETRRRLDYPMPTSPLTLDQAVLLAVSRHPAITSQIATIAQASGGIDAAKAGYYPQITFGTGSGSNTLYGNANTVSMQISQMLYDFGKVSSSVDQARATVKREQANLLLQLSTVEQKTAEALINAHRYQELVRVAAQQVDAVQEVYQMAKLRANSGVSTRSDPIQAETRVQSAQATLIEVKALNDETLQHLRTLVGGTVTSGIALPLADQRVAAMKLSATPNTTLMPNVLVALGNELITLSQLNNAKAQMWPTFSINYDDLKNVTGTNLSTTVSRGSNHSFTAGIQWNAYQGGSLAAQLRAAQFAYESAQMNVAAARLDGSDTARGYREQALGAFNRLSKLDERKESIAQTRDLYREQYKLGTRSILDLLNAEQEYYQAVLDQLGAQHDYWIALVDYIGALGTGNTFYGIASRSIQGVKVQ
jgi:adhesin transport system outer membrane protein